MAHNQTKCQMCGAWIVWAVTDTGKRIPLDVSPVYGGNVVLSNDCDLAQIVKTDRSVKRWVSHFSTCPQSKEWRG